MPTLGVITWLWNNRKWVGLIGLVLVLTLTFGYVKYLRVRLDSTQVELKTVKAEAAGNAEKHQSIVLGLTKKIETERTARSYENRIDTILRSSKDYRTVPLSPEHRSALTELRTYQDKFVSNSE